MKPFRNKLLFSRCSMCFGIEPDACGRGIANAGLKIPELPVHMEAYALRRKMGGIENDNAGPSGTAGRKQSFVIRSIMENCSSDFGRFRNNACQPRFAMRVMLQSGRYI